MELIAVLDDARAEILDEAAEGLKRSHLGHYEASTSSSTVFAVASSIG